MASSSITSINLNDYLYQGLYYLRNRVTTLQSQQSDLKTKYAIFNDLRSKLQALKQAAEAFLATGSSSVFKIKKVDSSDPKVVTASATGDAVEGVHSIYVTRMARAHTVVSNRYDRDDTALSSMHAGTKTFSITVGEETYDVSVTITSGETNQTVLGNLATAINSAAKGKVMASSVCDTPSTCKLSIASSKTGTANKMVFTDTDGLLSALGLTNPTQATDTVGGYIYADLGGNELDARLTVDGISIVTASNLVDDVIEGLTIRLISEQGESDPPVLVTVSLDVEGIKSKISEFLTAYNEAYSYLVSKTDINTSTYERGALAGDYPYVSLRNTMRQMMNIFVEGASKYKALSQIGIRSGSDGKFSITNPSLLEEAIAGALDDLEMLFSGENGIAARLVGVVEGYTRANGTISSSQNALNSKIRALQQSISRQQKEIALREAALRKQFQALQEMLYALQESQSIADIYSSLLGL